MNFLEWKFHWNLLLRVQFTVYTYTARQLCGITLPVPAFCLTTGEKSRSASFQGPWHYSKDLSLPSGKLLWSTITYVQSQSTIFLGSVDFSNRPKESVPHLCWSHSVVSRRYMQITKLNYSGNHVNQYEVTEFSFSIQNQGGGDQANWTSSL